MTAFKKHHTAEYLQKWPRCVCSHSKQIHVIGCRRCACDRFRDVLSEKEGYPGGCMTASGIMFYPLAPRVEDVRIKDIAHQLAATNRFTGATRFPYCPTEDQRILTADLRWIPSGDMTVGTELLGFDEHLVERGSAAGRRRRYRFGQILTVQRIRRPVIRLEIANGATVKAAAEHPWLVATKQSGNQEWATAAEIATAISRGHKRYMKQFIEPWSFSPSRAAGWLAGMYDGEGHLSIADRKGCQLGLAQNQGLVLDEIVRVLNSLGFKSLRLAPKGDGRANTCVSLQMMGGWREVARLLGSVRPVRLLEKFVSSLRAGHFTKQMEGQGEPLEVVKSYKEPDEWVVGLETSTRTYICEGFGAHNSVAQHSVIVSSLMNETPMRALYGLLHDASEAYLGDVPRPLKYHPDYVFYHVAEARLQAVIYDALGLDPRGEPEDRRTVDRRVLRSEQAALMPPAAPNEDRNDVPVYPQIVFQRWTFEEARREFLGRFYWLQRQLVAG